MKLGVDWDGGSFAGISEKQILRLTTSKLHPVLNCVLGPVRFKCKSPESSRRSLHFGRDDSVVVTKMLGDFGVHGSRNSHCASQDAQDDRCFLGDQPLLN
jgi:hypothetical protein